MEIVSDFENSLHIFICNIQMLKNIKKLVTNGI